MTICRELLVTVLSCAYLISCTRSSEQAKSDPIEPAPIEKAQQVDPGKAKGKGQENARAMMRSAEECEPLLGHGKVEACQRACELNHSNSCANWGRFLESSDGSRARQLYQRACAGGSGIGCEAQARMAARAGDADAAQHYVNARRYHRVHCSQDYARSCLQLGELLRAGLGGAIDPDTGRMYENRAHVLQARKFNPKQ